MTADITPNVVVRVPSWGPPTVHGSLDSVLRVHQTDRVIVAGGQLGMDELVGLLEEGHVLELRSPDDRLTVSYRVVPVV